MRIVMAAHSFPRVEGDVAGAFLWRLAEALVDRGHGVTVVAPADRGDVGGTMLGRVRVRRVRYAAASRETLAYQGTMHRLAASPAGMLAFRGLVRAMGRAVTEEVRASSANIIHAHWWVPGGLAVRLGDRAGRPWIVTLHGTDVALARKLPLGLAAMGWVLRSANAVTAVSSFLATEAAAALGVNAKSIPLTPMPLALGRNADPDAARNGAVFVGRLTSQKHVGDLLTALAMLRREGVPQDLTIVGDGPERPALKAQAMALGLTVTFTGFVAPELVAGHLRDKRVFILPAVDEGLGLVVAEALTQGVPVVATRSGGIPDLMTDPDAGILVPPSNPQALAVAIRSVTTEERFRVGAWRAGKSLAERLSPEAVAARFEEIYTRSRASRATLAPPGGP
jgi:glycosyltransferase involved in cell wall biosynthesis